jgi:DNA invertase Pin-like site-specific DNA recombinase
MSTNSQQTSGERWLVAARLSRMSKKDRARPELITGITTQDERSTEWAAGEGHVIVHVTRDRSVSGAISPWERPELGPWLTDPAKVSQYDGIVAYEASRVSRDYADLPMLRKWAERHGKKLYVIKERLRWPDDRDGMLWAVAAERAYQERQDTIERTKRELDALRAAGKLAGRYPWGYASSGEKYDRVMVFDWLLSYADEDGQRVHYVTGAYRLVAAGESLADVAEWLSGETGRAWWPRTIAAMVRNTSYRGEHRTASGKTVHKCPPLVTGELWRDANAALDSRPSNRRGQRTDITTPAALLSGIVACGNPACDATGEGPSPMYKIVPPGREPHYRCAGRGAKRQGCGTLVPLAELDALMDQAMSGLRRPVTRVITHPATGHQAEIDDITQALRDLPLQDLDEDAEDAARARLRAERRRLAELPASPAWTERVETGETYGAKWQQSGAAERRAWLRDAGFAVYAGRPGMLDGGPGEDEDDGALSRWDAWTGETAALAFAWDGDEDPGLARGQVA